MSILIKGMDMPHEEVEPLHLELYADGTVFFMKAPDDCYEFKAVPVQPHGRLIDAEKLFARVTDYYGTSYTIDMICDAPTIIPAEGISKTENTTEEGET